MRVKTGKELNCPVCNKKIYLPACRIKAGRKYCSKKCGYIGRGQTNTGRTHFKKGMIPWNKGLSGYMGANKTSFKKGNKPWNDGIARPEIRNEKHPRWKGGVTPLRVRIYNSYKYVKWRKNIFERDNYTCVLCGKTKCYIEADHYPKPFYKIRDENNIKNYDDVLECKEFWDIKNGRTLCKSCHKIETKKLWRNKKKNGIAESHQV